MCSLAQESHHITWEANITANKLQDALPLCSHRVPVRLGFPRVAHGQDIVQKEAAVRLADVDGHLDEPPVSLQVAELRHLIKSVAGIADLLGIQEVEGALRLLVVVLDLGVAWRLG